MHQRSLSYTLPSIGYVWFVCLHMCTSVCLSLCMYYLRTGCVQSYVWAGVCDVLRNAGARGPHLLQFPLGMRMWTCLHPSVYMCLCPQLHLCSKSSWERRTDPVGVHAYVCLHIHIYTNIGCYERRDDWVFPLGVLFSLTINLPRFLSFLSFLSSGGNSLSLKRGRSCSLRRTLTSYPSLLSLAT